MSKTLSAINFGALLNPTFQLKGKVVKLDLVALCKWLPQDANAFFEQYALTIALEQALFVAEQETESAYRVIRAAADRDVRAKWSEMDDGKRTEDGVKGKVDLDKKVIEAREEWSTTQQEHAFVRAILTAVTPKNSALLQYLAQH